MSRLTLQFFGPPEVRRSDGLVLPALRTRKGLWLLALLVLRAGKTVERVWLAGQLWPDVPTENGLANLRRTLTDLRRALGLDATHISAPTITTLVFDANGIACDVLTFDADPSSQLVLYQGMLLEGCSEEWVFGERRQREVLYTEARLARARSTPPDEACIHLRALLEVDPLHEDAVRRLMTLYGQLGRQSEALEVFRGFRECLSTQSLVPDPQTKALYTALQEKLRQPTPLPVRPKWAPTLRPQLPQPATPFVGRRAEQQQLTNLLLYEPLVTILGMGGMGKTRLALRLAGELSGEFAEGATFVELASLPIGDTLVATVARSLGRRSESLEELAAALAGQRLLLVLDNAENLLPACRTLIQTLRQVCPQVSFLVTSREPLELPGEVHWRLNPLSETDAQSLFVQCAGRTHPSVALEQGTVSSLCQQLEGIPLALELAAGRLSVLSPGQLIERLTERFRLLVGGAAHPQRHRTLHTVLESSWEQLSSPEQKALAQLSVFRGGWSLEGAMHVAFPSEDEFVVLDRLTKLVARSLVLAEKGRFRMLETVRLFVEQYLPPEGRQQAQTRLLTWLHALALRDSDDAQQQLWLERIEAERTNLRTALEEAWHMPELHALGLEVAICTNSLYRLRGGVTEARQNFTRFLGALPSTNPEIARGHWHAGKLAHIQGDFTSAWEHYDQAKTDTKSWGDVYALESRGLLARDLGELEQAESELLAAQHLCDSLGGNPLWCHGARATLAWLQGDYRKARALLEPVLAQQREMNNRISRASLLLWWAKVQRDSGEALQEEVALNEALTLSQELGYTPGMVGARYGQAERHLCLKNFAEAHRLAQEALTILHDEPNTGLLPRILLVQTAALRGQGSLSQAERHLQEALGALRRWNSPEGMTLALLEAGLLRQAQDAHMQATLLWGAAETLRQRHGFVLPPFLSNQFIALPNHLGYQEALVQGGLLTGTIAP